MFAMCSKLSETCRRCSARSRAARGRPLQVVRALAGQPLEQRVGMEEAEEVVEVGEEQDEGEGQQHEMGVEREQGDEVVLRRVLHQDGVEGDRRRQQEHAGVDAVLEEELEELQRIHVRGQGHRDGHRREHDGHQLVAGPAERVDEVARLVGVEGGQAAERHAGAQRVDEHGERGHGQDGRHRQHPTQERGDVPFHGPPGSGSGHRSGVMAGAQARGVRPLNGPSSTIRGETDGSPSPGGVVVGSLHRWRAC